MALSLGSVCGSGSGGPEAANQLLGLANGQLLPDHGVEDAVLELGPESAERRACPSVRRPRRPRAAPAGASSSRRSVLATVERAPDAFGDRFLREAELLDELAVGGCRLDRVEVGALQVLDERELEAGRDR